MVVTLFLRMRKSRALTCLVTIPFLRSRMVFQLSVIVPTPSIPCSAACFRWSYTSASKSRDLVGMQPTFRQVPPSFFSRSISATFNPYCPARMAAVYPPGPPPMIAMSYIVSATASSLNTKHLFYATVPRTRIPRCTVLCHTERVRPHLATLVADFRRYGEQIAVVTHRGNRRFSSTYVRLAELSARCAHAFDQLGLKPGDRVLLWGSNSVEWVAAFFGCVLRGIVAVPLDAAGSLELARRVVVEVQPRLLTGDLALLQQLNS